MRLLKYHSTSTGAVLANDKLLSALQENRLDVDPNGRAAHDYVITWETNAELYNAQLRDPNARLNDAQKLNMQTRSVGITQLLVVKTSIDMHIAQGNTPIEYPQYYALLLSACSTYDEANGLKNGPTEATTLRHSTQRINEKSTSLKVTLSMKPSSPSSTSQARPA
jgi:hypothetical protein